MADEDKEEKKPPKEEKDDKESKSTESVSDKPELDTKPEVEETTESVATEPEPDIPEEPAEESDGSEDSSVLVDALLSLGLNPDDIQSAVDQILALGLTEEEAVDQLDGDEIASILADFDIEDEDALSGIGDDLGGDENIEFNDGMDDVGGEPTGDLLSQISEALASGTITEDDLRSILSGGGAGSLPESGGPVTEPEAPKQQTGNTLARLIGSLKF